MRSQINFSIDPSDKKAIEAAADDLGMTTSKFIMSVLRPYCDGTAATHYHIWVEKAPIDAVTGNPKAFLQRAIAKILKEGEA